MHGFQRSSSYIDELMKGMLHIARAVSKTFTSDLSKCLRQPSYLRDTGDSTQGVPTR